MVWISCTTNPHHIVAQLTLSSCITNGHYHQAQQLHLSVCPQWSDFILRLRQSGLKSHTAIQPPSRNKKVVCYFSTRFQPWLGIVTVNTTPSYNINCLLMSLPNQSNYGKAIRTEDRRNAIRDSLRSLWPLAWLDIAVRTTRWSVRHTASRHWACVKGVHADSSGRSAPCIGLWPSASPTRRLR